MRGIIRRCRTLGNVFVLSIIIVCHKLDWGRPTFWELPLLYWVASETWPTTSSSSSTEFRVGHATLYYRVARNIFSPKKTTPLEEWFVVADCLSVRVPLQGLLLVAKPHAIQVRNLRPPNQPTRPSKISKALTGNVGIRSASTGSAGAGSAFKVAPYLPI